MDVGMQESVETAQRRRERLEATVRAWLADVETALDRGDLTGVMICLESANLAARALRKHLTGRDR